MKNVINFFVSVYNTDANRGNMPGNRNGTTKNAILLLLLFVLFFKGYSQSDIDCEMAEITGTENVGASGGTYTWNIVFEETPCYEVSLQVISYPSWVTVTEEDDIRAIVVVQPNNSVIARSGSIILKYGGRVVKQRTSSRPGNRTWFHNRDSNNMLQWRSW